MYNTLVAYWGKDIGNEYDYEKNQYHTCTERHGVQAAVSIRTVSIFHSPL